MVERRILDRIFARRRITDSEHMTTPCWEFTGARTAGYGVIGTGGSAIGRTHRLAYQALVGPIPATLQLDHLCRNRACFNPKHLEPVTSRENTMRGENFAAKNAAKTHCVNGHEFTPENTYPYRGWRHCRTCRGIRRREKAGSTPQPWDVTEVRIKGLSAGPSYDGTSKTEDKGDVE